MAGVEKISIALTPDLAALVQEAVKSGGYASTSEVIREALRDWRTKQQLQEQVREIRDLWREGIQSGAGRFRKVGEIVQEATRESKRDISALGSPASGEPEV